MKRIEERILLDHAGVDQISERIENWLGQIGTGKKDIVRTRGDAGEGVSQIDKLVELIFSAFPKDMFSPFIEGSMLQIVFIAVVIEGK